MTFKCKEREIKKNIVLAWSTKPKLKNPWYEDAINEFMTNLNMHESVPQGLPKWHVTCREGFC